MILRLIEPTWGDIRFNQQDILRASGNTLRRLRRDMQIIFQDPFASLDPRMRIEEIVAEPLVIHDNGLSRSALNDCAREMLQAVGLDESALHRYPHEFSGGQRQ